MDEVVADDAARASALLAWGSAARRDLPWRSTRDPWRVLVSEVMLQQTQVARVVPRYEAFLDRWPDPRSCAAAELAEVLTFWSGLGYPRRARDLHAAAVRVVQHHDGALPEDLDALLALPGIGPYTARAVLVFAHERDVGVVDTNVGRILARWSGVRLRPREAQRLADSLVPPGRGWDWGQAVFDLGAVVCSRRDPGCDACPVSRWCAWRSAGGGTPDPAVDSAAVSRRQGRYEGSDRQLRGRLLRALEKGPVTAAAAIVTMQVDDPARAHDIVEGLVADGLVGRGDGALYLGGVSR